MLYNIGAIQRLIVRCNMVSVETMTHRNIHVAAQQVGGQTPPSRFMGRPPLPVYGNRPPLPVYGKTPPPDLWEVDGATGSVTPLSVYGLGF